MYFVRIIGIVPPEKVFSVMAHAGGVVAVGLLQFEEGQERNAAKAWVMKAVSHGCVIESEGIITPAAQCSFHTAAYPAEEEKEEEKND